MKKTILLVLIATGIFALNGCSDTITEQGDNVSVNCGEGGCGDVIVGDNNQIHNGEESQADATSSVDFDLDNFDAKLSQRECNDLGFFYCTLVNECQPQPLDSGSCPNR